MCFILAQMIYKKNKEGVLIFNMDNQSFRYNPARHIKKTLSESEFEKIKDLLDLEHQEYLKSVKKIMKTKGFKPPTPINHTLLKVFIVYKIGNKIESYETDWAYSKH